MNRKPTYSFIRPWGLIFSLGGVFFFSGHGFGQETPAPAVDKPVAEPAAKPPETPSTSVSGIQAWRERIGLLVHQLGHANYFVRESAQSQLAKMGYDVVDALTAAQNHEDLEIAKRATYLLRGLKVELKDQLDDLRKRASQDVRLQLDNYENEQEATRRKRIEALAKLPQDASIPALCRLVQFEQSSQLSREAALVVLRYRLPPGAAGEKQAEVMLTEVSNSLRAGAEWVRVHVQVHRQGEKAWDALRQLTQVELEFLRLAPHLTSENIVLDLLRYQANLAREAGHHGEARATMLHMVSIEKGESRTLIELVEELFRERDFKTLDEVAAKFSDRVQQNAPLLYRLAEARKISGKPSEADTLVKRALELNPQDRTSHFRMAYDLGQRGLWDWSELEYQKLTALGLEGSGCSLAMESDSEEVRQLLEDYLSLPVLDRQERIGQFLQFRPMTAISALGRLVRFEPNDMLSRSAAVGVLMQQPIDHLSWPRYAEEIDHTLGPSQRAGAKWLKSYVAARETPAPALGEFETYYHSELNRPAAETSPDVLFGLLFEQYRLLLAMDQKEKAQGLLKQMTESGVKTPANVQFLANLLQLHEEGALLEKLAEQNAKVFQTTPVLLFQWAEAARWQKKISVAEQLAARARALIGRDNEKQSSIAFELGAKGLHYWAEEEYRRMIDSLPALDNDSMNAKVRLAGLLEEQEKWTEAIELLNNVRMNVEEGVREGQYSQVPNFLLGRIQIYQAHQAAAAGDTAKRIDHLERAMEFAPGDADLLIGLFQATKNEPAKHKDVVQKINELVAQFQEQIQTEPTNSLPYNQLAWLVSNTEGDQQAALQA